jgi:hypothetical protein
MVHSARNAQKYGAMTAQGAMPEKGESRIAAHTKTIIICAVRRLSFEDARPWVHPKKLCGIDWRIREHRQELVWATPSRSD